MIITTIINKTKVGISTSPAALWVLQLVAVKYRHLLFSKLASGRFFTILPVNPGVIVGCFIHKFVCCLWMSKTGDF